MKRANIIALLVFLGFLAWVFAFNTSTTNAAQSKVLQFMQPVFNAGNAVQQFFARFTEDPKDIKELRTENEELKKKIAQLQVQHRHMVQLEKDVKRLNNQLGFIEKSPFDLESASITSRSTGEWSRTVVINKGTNHGLKANLPVLSQHGLVGKITQTSPDSSIVILLTDEKCKVACKVEGCIDEGIVMGDGNISGERASTTISSDIVFAPLKMKYLPKDRKAVQEKAKVTSSGTGGVFPRDIPVGTVTEFNVRDLYAEAIVEPAVDFATLKDVFK